VEKSDTEEHDEVSLCTHGYISFLFFSARVFLRFMRVLRTSKIDTYHRKVSSVTVQRRVSVRCA